MDVLVEARREYLQSLYECMVPEMISSFYRLYLESEKMLKNQTNRLIQYQKFLQEIKNWNNSIVREHADAIKRECPFFDDLIVAVIVSSVKIMSSVRLTKSTGKLSLNVPKPEDFVHECYKCAAEDIYRSPYVMGELMTDDEREEALWDRIAECIEKVIKRYIPLQQILSMNISSPTSASDLVIDDGPMDDTEDPDVQEEMPEAPLEGPEEVKEAAPQPETAP
ncbi:hypothetical protein EBT25_03180, partial [bacterium]|nr:hypothetical protein [bacterium]